MNNVSRLFVLVFAALLIGSVFSPVQAQDAPFITVWDTENSGETADDQIKIPGTGTDYQIIWEEVGNTSNKDTLTTSDEVTITFPNPGVYRVKISGDFTRIQFGGGDTEKIIQISQWGDIQWSTMEGAFQGTDLEISTSDTPNLSNVESTARMFFSSSILAQQSNINSWDVSNVTNMEAMFQGVTSFNENISEWNVANSTNMSRMFRKASSFNQEIGSWNVSSVEDMSSMFSEASSFNKDISSWDVSDVTDMSFMFDGAVDFNKNIGGWDVSNVESMEQMFGSAERFNQDLSGWDVSSVTNMSSMFFSASSFNQNIGNWDVSSVTDMGGMFVNATSFDQDISMWEVSSVIDMDVMFKGASSFDQSLGKWDVSNVEDMRDIFRGSQLSSDSYDRTIMGWSINSLKSNVFVGIVSSRYCNSEPFRNHIIEVFDWDIRDSGKGVNCPNTLAGSGSNQISNDGTFNFSDVPLTVSIFGVIGSGRITAAKYSNPPRNVEGISESDFSEYRVLIVSSEFSFLDSTKVRFPISEYGGISHPEEVTVYRRSQPGDGSFTALTTNVDDNGTPDDISDDTLMVTTEGSDAPRNGFGEFVFASDSNELPVELASFNGTTTDRNVRLTWQTASEQNNAGFEVQLKEESGWNQLGYVDSKADGGTTTEAQSYRYTTEDLSVGTHQFRLTQVDTDGSTSIHGPISVDIQMQKALKLKPPSPNPVSSTATLSFAVKDKVQATVAVYDMLGRKAATLFEGTPTPGESTRLQFDTSRLPSGSYIIRLRADGKTRVEQMTVVR